MAGIRTTVIGAEWAYGANDPPAIPSKGVTYARSNISPSEIQDGWKYNEIVDSSAMNEVMRRITHILRLVEKWGSIPWSPLTSYETGGRCIGTNNTVYVASQPSTDKNPATSPAYWKAEGSIPSGSIMVFGNTTTPIGWTRYTDWTDGSMLVVTNSVPTGGGSADPRGGHIHSGPNHNHAMSHVHATANHTLTIAQMPYHNHELAYMPMYGTNVGGGSLAFGTGGVWSTSYTGGGQAHNHGNTGTPSAAATDYSGTGNTGLNTTPRYRELIACVKD